MTENPIEKRKGHALWRYVTVKTILDYADQVGDEQAAAEFYISVNKIKNCVLLNHPRL